MDYTLSKKIKRWVCKTFGHKFIAEFEHRNHIFGECKRCGFAVPLRKNNS